jgi:putative endonuclease
LAYKYDKRTQRQKNEQKGRWAELYARIFLQLKGYSILAKRFKTPLGEIDIVAAKRNTLVGVEVKARKSFDDGIWAITPYQQQRITRAIKIFLSRTPKWASANIRFDIILVTFPYIKHLQHVWSESL